jgi:SPP1 family predicted phage head-tail adaptor
MLERQGKKTNASEMRHYIDIQAQTSTTDEEGGFTESWSDAYTNICAAIYPIKAQQLFEYKSIKVDATHIIKIRGAETIENGNRIVFGTRYFEVLTVENIQERGIEKVVTCKELFDAE